MSVLPHNDQTEQPATQRIGVWSVVWRNSYIPLPPGFPRCVLRVETPLAKGQGAGQCPAEVNECWEEMREYGYCVSWHMEAPPARRLSLESKQRIRRRNLWKRLLKRSKPDLTTTARTRWANLPTCSSPARLRER